MFGVLIERYEAKLKRYARKFLSRPDDIEDLVQDVFIKSYTNIQSFDASQKFSPWVYRIAHNIFVNELRRKERSGYGIFDIDTLLPQLASTNTADEQALSTELQEEMENLLERLPPKYREVLVLFYYQELSYQEISEVLEIPKTTVGVRITRGRVKLQSFYQPNETTS
jgi:RNA polymerase sigma-70 factor (ECF subfamily)